MALDKEFISNSSVMWTAGPLADLERAEGSLVYDTNGKRYIDMHAGIAVRNFGGGHLEIVEAVVAEMRKGLALPSSSFRTPALEAASATLAATFSPGAKVFWANSGLEANEATIKFMRAYHELRGEKAREQILAFEGSFHGRSAETWAAAGKDSIGLGTVQRAFGQIKFSPAASVEENMDAVKRAITPVTAGILIEPIQGEGGLLEFPPAFMQGLRRLADERGLLLAIDEVQTGMGRTGKLFGYQHSGIQPDIISLGKALGGGVMPVGASVVTAEVNRVLTKDMTKAFGHGTTFGGNPLATIAALKALELLEREEFIGKQADKHAAFIREQLETLKAGHPEMIEEVRGKGFMLGLKLKSPYSNMEVRKTLANNGLLTMFAGDNVLRFLPPLNIPRELVLEAAQIMDTTFRTLEAARRPETPPHGAPTGLTQVNPSEQQRRLGT